MDGDAAAAESEDWAGRATVTVVNWVDTVRAGSTGKALVASRAAVYFLAAGLIGIIVAVMALIMLVRVLVVLTNLIPKSPVADGEVWMAYLILGLIFTVVGRLLWKKKDI